MPASVDVSPAARSRLTPEPLPANLRSVQPGGGVCQALELAWGQVRRAWLRRARPGYVSRMASLRTGDTVGAPHDVLDPRDLKFCRNQCTADWPAEADPFRWREDLPFARWGLAELLLLGVPLAAAAATLCGLGWPIVALAPAVFLAWVAWFFRDPVRTPPPVGEFVPIVAPADGRIVDVCEVSQDPFVGGPAVRIGIFLSIFNVHINRAPLEARVIRLVYQPGKFLNALSNASLKENESLWIGLEEEAAPHRRLSVRQIAGQFARRIVCNLRSGEVVSAGHKFGMIKLGSRTELVLERTDDLEVLTQVGAKVQAGSSVLARYRNFAAPE